MKIQVHRMQLVGHIYYLSAPKISCQSLTTLGAKHGVRITGDQSKNQPKHTLNTSNVLCTATGHDIGLFSPMAVISNY